MEERSRKFVETEYQKAKDQEVKLNKEQEAEKRSVAFETYLRYGKEALTLEQRNLLVYGTEQRAATPQSNTGTAGGYLIPREFSGQIEKALKAYGGMLEAARIMPTGSGATMDYPTSDDTNNKGYIVGQNADVTEGSAALTFGTKTLSAYLYSSGFILIPETLIEDSFFDLQGFASEAIAERIARIMNEHMTIGDGSSKPQGLIPAASTGVNAAAAAISFDNLIDLQHSVNRAYRKGAGVAFMFNDNVLKVLRKIKDNDGRYIWQPADARTGAPASILGEKYIINDDMADVGASAKSVVYGDLSKYIIRSVNGFRIKRLVERFAEFDQVGFVGFDRFDGKLINTSAVKVLAHASS